MKIISQKWEGIVTDVCDGSFWAELHDLNNRHNPVEIAEILMSKIPEEEHQYIEEGAVFYWNIGYWKKDGKCFSEFKFLRPTVWTKRMLEKLEKKAKELAKQFGLKK